MNGFDPATAYITIELELSLKSTKPKRTMRSLTTMQSSALEMIFALAWLNSCTVDLPRMALGYESRR